MMQNSELCSLLSDLKEYGLLNKYPNLERAVKIGYQAIQANSNRQIDIYENQARNLKAACEGFMASIASEEVKPTIRREIKSPDEMIDKEALLEHFRNFK